MSNHKNHREGHVDKRDRALADTSSFDLSRGKRIDFKSNDDQENLKKIKNKKKVWR